jgi:threonine/homoserine/homoserine lactone efflux protein
MQAAHLATSLMLEPDIASFGVSPQRWAGFTLTEAAISLSPGPAVALVVACSLAGGTKRGLAASMGILSANLLYFALSALGIVALILAVPGLFSVLRWLGAAYLAWMGACAVLGRPSPLSIQALQTNTQGSWKLFVSGLSLQLANPKSILTFVAILPPFIDPGSPVVPQMLVYALSSMIPEFVILLGYSWLASRAQHLSSRPGFVLWTERVAGALMLLVALAVVLAP